MGAKNCQLVIKVAILLLFVSLGSAYFGTGPYEIKNFQLLPCDDLKLDKLNLTMQMYRTQDRTKRILAHRGQFIWPAGNNFSVFMKFYKWGTDWILMTEYEEGLCMSVSRVPTLWKDFNAAVGLNSTSCPLDPGHYTFDEWIIQVNAVTPVLPYGKYKALLHVYNEKKDVISCIDVLCDVVQKFS